MQQALTSSGAVSGLTCGGTRYATAGCPRISRQSGATKALLFALGSLRLGCGRRCRSGILVGCASLLLPQRVFFLAQLIGLSVGHVAELLHSSGEDFRGEDAVRLVDDDSDQALKLAGKKSMAAETDQQLGFLIEDLHPILHSVDHPDVVIAVDGNALWAREVSRAVARFAECADEFAVAIEDLDAVVQSVGDVQIAFLVDRQSRRPGEIAGCGEFVFVSAGADPALQLQSVSVVDQDLILFDVGNVEQAVLGIDGEPAGFDQIRR